MSRDPVARDWLRVVRYFKLKMHKHNRRLKRHDRPSSSAGYDAPKGAKGF